MESKHVHLKKKSQIQADNNVLLIYCASCYIVIRLCSVFRPWQKHEVQAVRSVSLSLVQSCAFLNQTLQVTGIHLQPADQVLHVALMFLVVQTIPNQIRRSFIRERIII